MADNSRAVNRVFTRKVICDLIENGRSDVFDYVVKRYIDDPSSKNHGQLISEIYAHLNKQQRNEYFYMNTLLNKLLSSAIVPIIEPVKIIPALNNSLSSFQDASLPVALVINPNVGDLTDEPQIINQLLEKYLSPNVIPAILTNESAEKGLIELKSKGVDTSEILTILNDPDLIETYQAVSANA